MTRYSLSASASGRATAPTRDAADTIKVIELMMVASLSCIVGNLLRALLGELGTQLVLMMNIMLIFNHLYTPLNLREANDVRVFLLYSMDNDTLFFLEQEWNPSGYVD